MSELLGGRMRKLLDRAGDLFLRAVQLAFGLALVLFALWLISTMMG